MHLAYYNKRPQVEFLYNLSCCNLLAYIPVEFHEREKRRDYLDDNDCM